MSEEADIPVEAELLLACAVTKLEPAARKRISSLLAQGYDYERLYDFAERHGLRPLLFRHLGDGSFGPLPRALEARLWQHSQQLRHRNALLEAELLAVLDALAAAGVPAAAHKGPVLARQAFGDAGLREYGDLDVLVPMAKLEQARALLHERGYRSKYPMSQAAERAFVASPAQYHLMLAHEQHGLLLELHWATDGEFPVGDTADPKWWQDLGCLRIGEREVACLAPRETLLSLLLHGSKHHWESLHWLVDVAELLRAAGDDDRGWLLEQAARMQVRRRVAFGLALLEGHWGLVLSFPATEWTQAFESVRPAAEQAARRWFEIPSLPLSPWQRLGLDLRLCDTAGQRWSRIVDTVARPGVAEWSRWPLPRWLFFLYLPLRAARLVAKSARRLFGTAT